MADILTQLQTCLDQVHPPSHYPHPQHHHHPHPTNSKTTARNPILRDYMLPNDLPRQHPRDAASHKHNPQRRAPTSKNPQERIYPPGPSVRAPSSTIPIASLATTTRHRKSPNRRAACRSTATKPRW